MTIEVGDVFYDDRHGRYLTVDGVGVDPDCFSCIEEEYDENGDLYARETVLMMRRELEKMDRQ